METKSMGPDTPENWDLASRSYADNVAPKMMESFAEEFVDSLDVSPATEVLEVAAGSGALTSTLARRARSVLASDFSPSMVEILRERMKSEGATNVECRVLDGQALDLPDKSYDRAACCFGLMLFPDRAKGFSELRRVLRPGGRAMVSGWAGPEDFETFGLFMQAVKRAFPSIPAPTTTPPVFRLANLETFRSEMEAAGFIGVETHCVTRELELSGADQVWAMLSSGAPPIQMLFERVGKDGKRQLREALVAVVTEKYGSGALRMKNVATLGCGSV